jgi:hypothetical protein
MFAFVILLFALLATASLAQPAERKSSPEPPAIEQPLCGLVRSAASAPQLEQEGDANPQEEETAGQVNLDQQRPIPLSNLSPSESLKLRADRELFESFLVNWRFFEDLAPRQRAIVRGVLARCGVTGTAALAASVFAQFNASQRATFVGITHALLNTVIVDRQSGKELGIALQLVEELLDIYGEDSALSSDKQFQVIVRLTPDAAQKLERAAHFEMGENHIFHKEYPISFRQFRKIGLRGQEAGLHFCLTRDGRFAQIHIDYRFGLLHLGPANSDVRADGNHQRHADRWPEFKVAIKPVRTRRVVLLSQN